MQLQQPPPKKNSHRPAPLPKAHVRNGRLEEPQEVTVEMESPDWSALRSPQPESTESADAPAKPTVQPELKKLDGAHSKAVSGEQRQPFATPYEAVLRTMLEQSAQEHFERIAGEAGKGVKVRVTLEWT